MPAPRHRVAPRGWHALTAEQKQARLRELRRRQQAQVGSDVRLLSVLR